MKLNLPMTDHKLLLTLLCAAIINIGPASDVTAQTKKKSTKTPKKSTPAATTDPSAGVPLQFTPEPPDIHKMPAPLEAIQFTFPKYAEYTSASALKVFVVNDARQPIVNVRLVIRAGDSDDPIGREGVATLAGEMLIKGAGDMNATQFARKLDGMGASLRISTEGQLTEITGSVLKGNSKAFMNLLSDILSRPTFDAGEFQKLKSRYIAILNQGRNRPDEMAEGLSRGVIYGLNHPYARRPSPASVAELTLEEVRTFWNRHGSPSNASLAFIGDVTEEQARSLEGQLKAWKKKDVPVRNHEPVNPMPAGIYFIARPGSVQSHVIISGAAPAVTSPNYTAARFFASIFGSGFGSVLNQTLRETYAYTYSPFGYVTGAPDTNRYALGASVRKETTDSSITVILKELRRFISEGPIPEMFESRKALLIGQFRMAFENSTYVASLLQRAWYLGIPVSDLASFDRNVEALSMAEVQAQPARSLSFFNIRIVVVGDPSIRETLEQFGPVSEYDVDLQPVEGDVLQPAGLSLQEIISRHIAAIGGSAVADVNSLRTNSNVTLTVQGTRYTGTMTRYQKVPELDRLTTDIGPVQQEHWVLPDGAYVLVSRGGSATRQSPDIEATMRVEARLFPLAKPDGLNLTVKGKRGSTIILEGRTGGVRTDRYGLDAKTFLLTWTEKEETTPQGPILLRERYFDYALNNGVYLPMRSRIINPVYSMEATHEYKVNTLEDPEIFGLPGN